MFSSRIIWRLFAAYAIFTLLAALAFISLLSGRQRTIVTERLEQRLHDSAVVIRSFVSEAFPESLSRQVRAPELQRHIVALGRENGTRITLVAADGTVLADSDEDPAAMENHRNRPELRQARRAGTAVYQRTSSTLELPMVYYALRIGSAQAPRGFVRVALPVTSVRAQVNSVQRLIWATAAIVGVGVLAFTYFALRRIIRPLETLTLAAQAIAAGNLSQEVDVPSRDELGTLADAFNVMSRELASRIGQLQRKQLELKENSDLLETVLGAMVEGVVVVDDRQQILFANAAAGPLLDFSTSDVVGRPVWEVARHPKIQEVVHNVLESEDLERAEFEVPRTKGVVALVATRLSGDPSPGAVLVLHDMTELRRLENIRRDFVSNVSHELKTPLTSIQAYTETLLDGAIDDPANNRKFLQRISHQAERLHAQILDLLKLARIESEQAAFDVRPVSVAETAGDCLESHAALAESKGIRLAAVAPNTEAAGQRVFADAEGLRTILDNLVDNAIKYSPPGSAVTVRWGRSDDAKMAWIEVADTGPGIGKEHLARLFERFYRVDKARSREVGGTGLGLAIVKHLAQVFGGSVAVSSELGKGSKFVVRLPAAQEEAVR